MQTTLTENRMVKLWAAAGQSGDWYELNKIFWEIAKVLESLCYGAAADEFAFLAGLALQRAVDDTVARKMQVAA